MPPNVFPLPIPLVVLAGHDQRPSAVPTSLEAKDMLRGNKGALELPDGRCLASELMRRALASGCFDETLLVGPRELFDGRVEGPIVHVSGGGLFRTLEAATAEIRRRYDPHRPVGLIASDILPTSEELRAVIHDHYLPHQHCAFWGQMVRADPHELGSSGWKPAYRFVSTEGKPELHVYPGHLVILRPVALRLRLVNRLFHLAYHYRNRPLAARWPGLTLSALRFLAAEDLASVAAGRPPLLTLSLPFAGLQGYYRFRRGTATVRDFSLFLARLLVHRRWYRSSHELPVAFSVVRTAAMAKDIDTVGEWQELLQSL